MLVKFNHPSLLSFVQLNVFCALLLAVRVAVTLTPMYLFLVWNLFLATVPLAITIWMESRKLKKSAWYGWIIVWLLFLPNAPYIVTDLLHFRNNHDVAAWFDLLLLSTFAFTGILLGLESLHRMHRQFIGRLGRKTASGVVLGCCLLCGSGIYLGRFLRFNSWDVIADPIGLASNAISLFTVRGVGVSAGFGLLFYVVYCFICNHFKPKYHASTSVKP